MTPEHRLSLRVVNRAGSEEIAWSVEGLPSLSFRSLDAPSLQAWISSLPEGSALRWAWPRDLPPGSAPRIARELKSFAEFCRSEGIRLEGEPLEARQRLAPQLYLQEVPKADR